MFMLRQKVKQRKRANNELIDSSVDYKDTSIVTVHRNLKLCYSLISADNDLFLLHSLARRHFHLKRVFRISSYD